MFRCYFSLIWLDSEFSWLFGILFDITTVSVITIFHCAISFWLALLNSSDWRVELFFIFKANANRDIQSRIVEIHIHLQARVLASVLSEAMITIAKINNKHHNPNIAHRKDWFSLLDIPKIIIVIHLTRAHKAKIQIIIVHTSWDHEKISQIPINASKRPQIQSNQANSLPLFLKALMTADVPPASKKNQRMISINFQNMLGEQTVIIQKIIMKTESHSINQDGHCWYVSWSDIKY